MTPRALRPPAILVVDDEEQNRKLLSRLLFLCGYEVTAVADGEAALAHLERSRPDLILLDVQMPGIDGFEVCQRIKQNPNTRLTPVVLVTALQGRAHKIKGIEVGADDFLTKPFDREELIARAGSLVRLKRHTDELESAESVILSLARTIEARDPYTQGHCERLAGYATALGTRLRLHDDDIAALQRGGVLHDVGKIGIADMILLKPAALTVGEYDVMKQHPIIGERLCGDLRSLDDVRPIIRHHHERRDGSGYPDGLSGDAIPLLAQIIAVVDTYDAITTTRPYRAARPPESACAELLAGVKQNHFRPDLVEAFVEMGQAGELEAIAARVDAGPHARHA
jgi:putative two-component system response regulator